MNAPAKFSHATTFHARKGQIDNRFQYSVDMALIDGKNMDQRHGPFMRISSSDHGSKKGGALVQWVETAFRDAGLKANFEILLLTQARVFGTLFNPVSFWIARSNAESLAFIAEVNNTFNERHFYICHHEDFSPIKATDQLTAKKVFYVSPFQEIAGQYKFNLDIQDHEFSVRIDFSNGDDGVVATLQGALRELTPLGMIFFALRRPLGGLRVRGLIYFQAIKLKLKGAKYRVRPKTPEEEIT